LFFLTIKSNITNPFHTKMNKRRIASNASTNAADIGCWVVILFLVITLIVVIVLVATHPYPVETYYKRGTDVIRTNCTVGEELDSELELCVPIIHTPIPVSTELMNTSISSCTSFYHYQVGSWITSHKNENRAFTYLHQKNQKQVHDLIRSPSSGPVYKFFRSCLDTLVNKQHAALDKAQVKHVKEHILETLQTHADLPVVFARLAAYGFNSPLVITIESHPTEPMMVPLIRWEPHDFAPVKLREWATDEDGVSGSFIDYLGSNEYKQQMTTMGVLYDSSPPNFWKLYLRELNGYAMEEDLESASRPVWVLSPKYIRSLLTSMDTITVNEWREYVLKSIEWNTKDFIPELPPDSYFRKHETNPAQKIVHVPHRMKRRRRSEGEEETFTEHDCLSVTHRLLPGTVGQMFLNRYMPDYLKTQTKIKEIVESVRDSFANLISDTEWMDPATRKLAVDKVRSIVVRAVVPNHWEPEPFVDRITMDCYLRNLNMVRKYRATRNFELWTSAKPDRDRIQRFSAPMTEVNAFYSSLSNTITFFAGIARSPFYDAEYNEVALYATIGMIAGHELAHSNDPNGRLWNKDGNLKKWWTSNDVLEYNKRVDCVISEYEAPMGCTNAVYGNQTVGEDIADLVGLKCAYDAYFNSGKVRMESDKKEFFAVFASMWSESYDQAHLCRIVNEDEHAIGWYRVDKTLRSIREFQHTYGCKKDDEMVRKKPCVIFG